MLVLPSRSAESGDWVACRLDYIQAVLMVVMTFSEEKEDQDLRVGGGLVKHEKNKTCWWKRKISLTWKKTREWHHFQKISRSANEAVRFSGQSI